MLRLSILCAIAAGIAMSSVLAANAQGADAFADQCAKAPRAFAGIEPRLAQAQSGLVMPGDGVCTLNEAAVIAGIVPLCAWADAGAPQPEVVFEGFAGQWSGTLRLCDWQTGLVATVPVQLHLRTSDLSASVFVDMVVEGEGPAAGVQHRILQRDAGTGDLAMAQVSNGLASAETASLLEVADVRLIWRSTIDTERGLLWLAERWEQVDGAWIGSVVATPRRRNDPVLPVSDFVVSRD